MRASVLAVALLSACTGTIGKGAGGDPSGKRPHVVDCGTVETPTTPAVYQSLRPSCVGCHDANAEFPLFATQANFEAMVVRNERFITPADPKQSALFAMLEGSQGALQMPPGTAYAAIADADEALPSLGALRCWVAALDPQAAPVQVAGALNRRVHAELLAANLEWALGLSPTSFATSGADYGLEDPDALEPRSTSNQYRAQQLGAPHWLEGVGRENELGTTFVQVTVQLSQAWCQRAASGGTAFYRHATATDGTATPASRERVRQNLAYLFERVTGESADPETLDGLVALFQRYEGVNTRTGWAAACSGIVRHPLSLTF